MKRNYVIRDFKINLIRESICYQRFQNITWLENEYNNAY